MVAPKLFLDVSQRILGTAFVELVDRDNVREVEHVDLFELGCGSVVRRHDVEGHVGVVCDLSVRLPDPACFENDQVKAGALEQPHGLADLLGHRSVALTGGE